MGMVQDLIERQGIPVFNNINVALNCTTKVLKENLSIEELGLKDQAQPVRLAHIQVTLINQSNPWSTNQNMSPFNINNSLQATAIIFIWRINFFFKFYIF